MDNVKNMNILVTGAARGIGLSCVQHMLKNGAKIVSILDLPTSAGTTTVADLEKKFGKGKALFFPCDVTNVKQFEETFKKAANAMGGIDIVINNAGVANDKNWKLIVDLNMGGVIHGSLLAMELMHKDKGGKGGIIVNISSIVGFSISRYLPAYCSSKHQVIAFSRGLAGWYEETGVRVLVMCPGVTTFPLIDYNLEPFAFDFVDKKKMMEVFNSYPTQGPENLAKAMVLLIQKGKNGSVWVSEGENPPYAIEFPPIKRVELNL
ncbi:15-hydroxyprostaglandin dehydrogenase [NAD(+)]-like [Lasioglossum baleicum]|uniref:15-hydroxyprostaglandin dehydrogenase [NAD(+)]-like n=1 Tax=Lasioglossum baleicum TaxID=434251 RepID=UPI003FCD2A98